MYKEWEYIYNTNIKASQSYSWLNHVLILDETDGSRRVMLTVNSQEMTPDCWRLIHGNKTFKVLKKGGKTNPFLVRERASFKRGTTDVLIGIPFYSEKEEEFSSMEYDWEEHGNETSNSS
jgi:hypothetical protein